MMSETWADGFSEADFYQESASSFSLQMIVLKTSFILDLVPKLANHTKHEIFLFQLFYSSYLLFRILFIQVFNEVKKVALVSVGT